MADSNHQGTPIDAVEDASKGSSIPSGNKQAESTGAGSLSKAKPLENPEYVIPGHDMLKELNRGGMGVVYKARQHGFNRMVAVKVILPERLQAGEAKKRFEREVRAAALLNHPNFVMVFQTDLSGPVAYLTMEYVDGIDLSRLVKVTGPLPIQLAVQYVVQAADALQHAADKGVIHRDIKPSNLMVTPSPIKGVKDLATVKPLPASTRHGTIKILDMGLARVDGDTGDDDEASNDLRAELTQAGEFLGTPDYMAPEQAENPRTADTRSDLYSLGATLFYLLSGQAVFVGGSIVQKLRKHLSATPPNLTSIRPEVPQALAQIVERLLRKSPAERYQTPAELALALRAFLQGKAVPMPSDPSGKATGPAQLLPPLNIRAHDAAISALALSPDGNLLATGGLDEAIKMWDAETGRPRRPMQVNGGAVNAVAFHPDGKMLASSASRLFTADMGVEIWDLTTGRQTRKLGNFSSNVKALCFDSKGLSLLMGCEDGEVRQCPLNEPTAAHKVLGRHPGGVLALVLLSSTRLLSAGGDGQVMVWDLDKGTIRGKIGFQVGPIRVLALDRSRNHLLAGGSGLVLRDGQANISNLLEPRFTVRGARFILSGTAIAAGCDDGAVRLIDTTAGVVVEERFLNTPVTVLVAAQSSASVWAGCADGHIRRLEPFELPPA